MLALAALFPSVQASEPGRKTFDVRYFSLSLKLAAEPSTVWETETLARLSVELCGS